MSIANDLRGEANQHPLDADLEMFNIAATRIEALESALILVTNANSNWDMSMDDKDVEAVQHFIDLANSDY